jgi:Na+/H+ antiporter NhaD/arsenite permease-like protein
VDWSLLLLFGGLFVVMRGVEHAGLAHAVVAGVAGPIADGTAASALARMGAAVTILSQAVSNVPAVMLFLPTLEALPAPQALPTLQAMSGPAAGSLWLGLAAFSTLAGNLTIIGSVANVIVFETARRDGVEVGFLECLKVGAPLTLATLLIAWAVLVVR